MITESNEHCLKRIFIIIYLFVRIKNSNKKNFEKKYNNCYFQTWDASNFPILYTTTEQNVRPKISSKLIWDINCEYTLKGS